MFEGMNGYIDGGNIKMPLSAQSTTPDSLPVAAHNHLLTVNDDELLQGLPGEAATCLAAVRVPTCAPYTHILGQGWRDIEGLALREWS